MLVQPQLTKDDDNEPVPMNLRPTPTETAPEEHTPVTFNVLLVGQAGVGKSGLIKLLLDTSPLSPATSLPQLARLAEFANFAATCPTNSPSPILAELPATPHRPEILLKLIDTPGLLYHDSHELEAGLQLVLRQIAESFEASNRVSASAQERRDKQIHLCLYLLDPADVVPASTRHLRRPERYGVSPQLTRQRVQLSAMRTAMTRPEEGASSSAPPPEWEDMPHYDDSPEDEWGRATVPTAELNVIRRLSEYVTVLPVVAKADTLTIERLDTVKRAIRRDLIEAGISFAPFESQNTGTTVFPSTPPPDPAVPAPLLPYAVMIPDRYHHGDGVLRSGTSARPTNQQYMARYQEILPVEKDAPSSVGGPFVQRQDLTRTYRWGVVNILDPSCSDFLALRDAILGPHVQTLRTYTDDVFFENHRRNLPADPRFARDLPESRQQSYSGPEQAGRSLRSNPPSLPAHSLEAYKTDTRSSYPQPMHPSPSQYSLAPLEHPPPSGNVPLRSNPPTLTPLSTMLHNPIKYGQPNPSLVSPDADDASRSPDPSPIQPPKHRTGRKVAVACNFCRSRKLKCDGGRPQCLQCIRRSVDCEYEPTAKRRGLARPSDAPVTGSEEYPQGQGVGTSPRVAGGDVEQGVSAPPKSVACQFCRARKTRCDGLQPRCSNCSKRNQECVYTYGPSYAEDDGSSSSARRFPSSAAGTTSLPSIQSLPLGTALSESAPPPTGYWQSSSPQLHSTLPPRRSQFSPLTRTRSIPGPTGLSSTSLSRHQAEGEGMRGFGSFPPPPAYSTSYTSETRRPSTSGAESQNWRDRSSFSSTSTRGGMSATPSTPNLKRKASHPEEEDGDGEVIRIGETSPSPPKRRRISGPEEIPFSSSTERRHSHPSREEAEEGEGPQPGA